MKRSLVVSAALAVATIVLTACNPNKGVEQAASTPPTQVTTAPAPSPSSALPEFTQADAEHFARLQKEHPKYFTECPNQEVNSWWGNIGPNLQVLGVVRFVGEYPAGLKLEELDTKFTVKDHAKPGWAKLGSENNVTIEWSRPRGTQLHSVIIDWAQLTGKDRWVLSPQLDRSTGYSNFHKNNARTSVGDRWFIMGYNPSRPCAGRESDLLDPYNEIDWIALFRNGQLDLVENK